MKLKLDYRIDGRAKWSVVWGEKELISTTTEGGRKEDLLAFIFNHLPESLIDWK